MELDFGDPTDPKYGNNKHYPGGHPEEPLFDHKLASLFKSRNKSVHALEFHVEQSAYREYMRMMVSSNYVPGTLHSNNFWKRKLFIRRYNI